METRVLIAYFLILVLLAAASFLVRRIVVKKREHRRAMRGRGFYKPAARRSFFKSLTGS